MSLIPEDGLHQDSFSKHPYFNTIKMLRLSTTSPQTFPPKTDMKPNRKHYQDTDSGNKRQKNPPNGITLEATFLT